MTNANWPLTIDNLLANLEIANFPVTDWPIFKFANKWSMVNGQLAFVISEGCSKSQIVVLQ
jgi:hypothetical protein